MTERRKSSTEEVAEMFKAAVRPILIVSTWWMILAMAYEGRFDEIPYLILGAGVVIAGEYGLERAKKRWMEPKNQGKGDQ